MNNAWAWVAAGAVFLLAFGRGAAAVAAPRAKPSSVLIIGDSHSAADWTFGGLLGARLNQAGIPTTVRAKNGASVWWWLRNGRLADLLAQLPAPPDLVLVELGGVDAARQPTQDEYAGQLYQFVSTLRAAGAKQIIWLSPTKNDQAAGSDLRRQEIAEWQLATLSGLDVSVIPMRPLTDDLETTDGVHMGRAEYLIWTDRILAGPLDWLVL